LRPGASDSCLEEVQVGRGYILVKGEVDVVGMGFEDVIIQLGSAIDVVEVVVGFLRVEDMVMQGRSGSRRRHEDDESVEELENVGEVVFF